MSDPARDPAPVDLRRMPWPLRYGLSLLIIAAVVAAAWFMGRDDPVPSWISHRLVPILGWTYLALVAIALAGAVRRRRTRTPPE
ncbi:MAG TPA: hypothetical protein VNP72_09440 [Longimicrobium sp.]|nr:hypothetical protein [Longimicrobium sp.]